MYIHLYSRIGPLGLIELIKLYNNNKGNWVYSIYDTESIVVGQKF